MNKLQQFVQKKCVLAAHPGKTLKKALELDLLPKVWKANGKYWINSSTKSEPREVIDIEYYTYPITLPRIMGALGNYAYYNGQILEIHGCDLCGDSINNAHGSYFECDWKLYNEDGTDALFEDQTPETQEEIAKLLGF